MEVKRITPEQGKVYKNKGGGEFRCIRGYNGNAVMQNVASKWTFKANGVIQYEDGTIEWDYSTGGHFEQEAQVYVGNQNSVWGFWPSKGFTALHER